MSSRSIRSRSRSSRAHGSDSGRTGWHPADRPVTFTQQQISRSRGQGLTAAGVTKVGEKVGGSRSKGRRKEEPVSGPSPTAQSGSNLVRVEPFAHVELRLLVKVNIDHFRKINLEVVSCKLEVND